MAAAAPFIPIATSIIGGMMSSGDSGGGTTQTVQRADPWSGVQPSLHQLYSSANDNFMGQGQQYYPNSTVTGQSAPTQFGQQSLYGRALGGSPVLAGAQDEAQRTLGGGYFDNPSSDPLAMTGYGGMLGSNPFLDSTFDQAASRVGNRFSKSVMPGIASMFSGAGRYGSNQMADAMGTAGQGFGDTLNDLATKIYGGNYGAERMLQQQALGEMGTQFGRERALQSSAMNQAPGLAQSDYTDINALMGLGTTQDAYSQNVLNSDVSRWDFDQQQPMQRLQQFSSLLSGASPYAGRSGSLTQPSVPGNPLMGALGGAMTGSSIYGNIFGGGGNAAQGFTSGGGTGMSLGSGYSGMTAPTSSNSLWPGSSYSGIYGGGSSAYNLWPSSN